MKRVNIQQSPASKTPGFFSRQTHAPFFTKSSTIVQKQPAAGADRIHSHILDQYSRETGIPRDQVTQHDPGYEGWLSQRPGATATVAASPVNITVNMALPAANPAPDYSRDETRLGAWEKANLRLLVQQFANCDSVLNNGVESSFVTDVNVQFSTANFEYFIASHIYDNMNDMARHISERNIWRQIHSRIVRHSSEHFNRYRQTVDLTRQDLLQQFAALPNRNNPIRIPKNELQTYMNEWLPFLIARMNYRLWQTTCDWERTDYPVLLQGIRNVGGRFVPACGPPPVVPAAPIMPVIITPGTSATP